MERFYDFFIGRHKTQVENYSNAKLIINFTIVEIIVSLIYVLVHDQFNFHVPKTVYFIFCLAIVSALFLFRSGMESAYMAHVNIAVTWISFMMGISYSGGIYSPILAWMAIMPIMANLLITRNAAKLWAAISLGSIIFFLFFFKNHQITLDEHSDWRSLLNLTGLVIVIFFFSDLFSRAKDKLNDSLKISNHELKEQKEEVVTQNEELIQQRNEIAAQRDHIERQNKLLREQNLLVEKINEELAKKVREIFDRNAAIEKHWHTLLAISKSRSINFGDFDEALKHIVKTAADSLATDRVSVWQYETDRRSIKCLVLYELKEGKYTQQEELLAKDFPRYFEALQEEVVIPADDAETDSHTFEFKEAYLKPHHIESMMDTPYFLDGKLGGVLCCENLKHRHWLPEDIIFAQALSDIITLVYRAMQRREYEAKIREHKKEISRVNFDLEERIKERTSELEIQNHQLAEYAFINSHLLRGPLCRLLGLINLIDHTEIQDKERDLISHLKLSGEELDEVVKKINSAIEKGGHFDRKEFGNFDRN
jgi:hypothetical protein